MSNFDYCPTTNCANCGYHICKKQEGNEFEQLQSQLAAAQEEVATVKAQRECLKLSNRAFRGDFKEQERHLKEYHEQLAWIPIGERLPKEDVKVLVVEGKFVQMGVYQRNSSTLRMQWIVNGCISKRIARWRALPEQ